MPERTPDIHRAASTNEAFDKEVAEVWEVGEVRDDRWPTLLKEARGARAQTDVVAMVNAALRAEGPRLTQSALSAWETGARAPIVSKKPFCQLLTTLGLSPDGGKTIVVRGFPAERLKLPRMVRDFQADVRTTLEKGGKVDLWLVGPTHLPILHSDDIRKVWAENLVRGANYRIIWFIDKDVSAGQLLFNALSKIESHARVGGEQIKGHIYHYPINLTAAMSQSAQQWFELAKVREVPAFSNCYYDEESSDTINILLPIVELITPDMIIEERKPAWNQEKLSEFVRLTVRCGERDQNQEAVLTPGRELGSDIVITPASEEFRGVAPLLQLWLGVRREWLDNWSLDSSFIFYNLRNDSESWHGAARRSSDEGAATESSALEDVEPVPARLQLAFERTIPGFRYCFRQFVQAAVQQSVGHPD